MATHQSSARQTTDTTQLRFRDLMIGQTFDFVDPAPAPFNSFYARVYRSGARTYTEVDNPQTTYHIGSINARVHHVGASVAWENRP